MSPVAVVVKAQKTESKQREEPNLGERIGLLREETA
jgi:hypothetical protein